MKKENKLNKNKKRLIEEEVVEGNGDSEDTKSNKKEKKEEQKIKINLNKEKGVIRIAKKPSRGSKQKYPSVEGKKKKKRKKKEKNSLKK